MAERPQNDRVLLLQACVPAKKKQALWITANPNVGSWEGSRLLVG